MLEPALLQQSDPSLAWGAAVHCSWLASDHQEFPELGPSIAWLRLAARAGSS